MCLKTLTKEFRMAIALLKILVRRDSRVFGVHTQFRGFSSNTFENIIDKRVQDAHCFVGDTSKGDLNRVVWGREGEGDKMGRACRVQSVGGRVEIDARTVHKVAERADQRK